MVDDTTNNGDQIVLFADFDSANMARYEKVINTNKAANENNNSGNTNKNTTSADNGL